MNIKRLFKISRPRFWIYELGPYVIGIAAALGSHSSLWISLPLFVFFLFFMYPANIFIYGINDIFDYETDKLNPKKVEYESLVIPSEQRPLALHILLICLPFLVYAFFISSWITFIFFLAFFFFAGFYSSKPIRAKARPFFDSFFSASHYIVTAGFSFFLTRDLFWFSDQITYVSWKSVALSLAAGLCWAMAMHAYSAVPDIKADGDAGLKTIATFLGGKGTLIFCIILYALSGAIAFHFIGIIGIILSAVYVIFMILSCTADEKKLFTLYTFFPFINTISGAVIFFAVLLRL